jgi:hypothetical protein
MPMAKAKKHASRKKGAARSSEDGRFMGVRIADPVIKPVKVTVEKIRRAVDNAIRKRA